MKKLIKTSIKAVSVAAMVAGVAMPAFAGTYYVYKKGSSSTCDISTKSPSSYNRGSKYRMVARDSTRSGAKKKGQSAGCSSF